MNLSAFPFVFDPSERHRWLSSDEHAGLRCLLDRAQHFGGGDDIFFLCLTTCSLLVRFVPDKKTGRLSAFGFAFKKQQESWIWLYLPQLLRIVFAAPPNEDKVRLMTEDTPQFDTWLAQHQPQLHACAQQFARDTARQMHPYSVAFSHIDPSLYGDIGIRWYAIAPPAGTEQPVPCLQPEDMHDFPAQSDSGAVITPPVITRTWRVVDGDERHKLGRIDDISDWYTFERRVRRHLTDH